MCVLVNEHGKRSLEVKDVRCSSLRAVQKGHGSCQRDAEGPGTLVELSILHAMHQTRTCQAMPNCSNVRKRYCIRETISLSF